MANKAIPANIICGFPGIGKTSAARQFPQFFRDLDSSEFHWITNESGERVLNPEWPNNYLTQIAALDNSAMYRAVFVSSHDQVRKALHERGIHYVNIYPEDTPEMKTFMRKRLESAHSDKEFVDNLMDKYSAYVQSMRDDKNCIRHIEVGPKNIQDWVTLAAYA